MGSSNFLWVLASHFPPPTSHFYASSLPFDPHITPPAYMSADVPGIGGVLKSRPEDFLVEEIPAYEPCGEGEHLYLWVQKRGMATLHMLRLLADHFGVKRDAVSCAGLKDTHAVTTQMVSIHLPGKKDADLSAFQHEQVSILWTHRHANKLRRGHLKGNRFIIRVRNARASQAVHAHKALMKLVHSGAPNRIGAQRFGMLGNNHIVGRALILGDFQGALDALLGPNTKHPEVHAEARALFAAGKYEDAMHAMPRSAHAERRCLSVLARGEDAKRAVYSIERLIQSFLVTAWQSAVFNAVLDERIGDGTYARLLEGDLAFKHDNGAVFPIDAATLADTGVVDPNLTLAARLKRVDISPSGPMWGPEMTEAAAAVGEMELRIMESSGVPLERLRAYWQQSREALLGQRRALRIPVTHPDVEGGMDEHGEYVKLRFELPRGSFATSVMQEIMKVDPTGEEEDA